MAGSSERWTSWLREHTPRLLLFARQQTRGEADARDVLQDVLRECVATGREGPPELALAFSLIRRRAIDLARRDQRREARELATAPDWEGYFDLSPEQREREAGLLAALKRLPAEHREVLALKIWGDLTFAEIGSVLGLSPNTAASRYRLALATLRQKLQPLLA